MRGGPRRGGETERTRFHRLAARRPWSRSRESVGTSRDRRAVTHHEGAERGVAAPARRSRSRAACCRSRSRYSGKLSHPRDPLVESGAGMSSTPSMRRIRKLGTSAAAPARSPPRSSPDDGRDALPRRRRQQRIPRDLAVVVGVHVDQPAGPAGRGVDLFATLARTSPTCVSTPSSSRGSASRPGAPVRRRTTPALITRRGRPPDTPCSSWSRR